MKVNIPRILVAGAASSAGKTTVTLALMAALTRRGFTVAPFKAGPDYIDPQLHRRACGRPGFNLDRYMTGEDGVRRSFLRGARGADVAVIEGVMGLFDGISPSSNEGSSADVARILDAPILLVVDASAAGRSVAAVVHGFATFDPETRLSGVLLNRLCGPSHRAYIEPALASLSIPLLGAFLRDKRFVIPERHLGLLPSDEEDRVTPLLGALADAAEETLDLDGILRLAREHATEVSAELICPSALDRDVRIAWATDEVFHFQYEENRVILEELGAAIVPFSPLRDAAVPDGVDAIWIGGGFPEVFATRLSENRDMLASLRAFAERGGVIYAECGGLMYLAEWFEDREGRRIPLAGLVPGGTRMTSRLQRFGYAEGTAIQETILGPAGTRIRGHRFHYSEHIEGESVAPAWRVRKNSNGDENREGFVSGNLLASYLHLHLGGAPACADHLVRLLRARQGGFS